MSNYKKSKTFNERCQESAKILEKHPDRIPILVEKDPKCDLKNIDKNKFLVPADMSLSQFIYVIRKRVDLDSSQALFFFINNTVPNNTIGMSTLYNTHKDKDGFLYITYNSENTFG